VKDVYIFYDEMRVQTKLSSGGCAVQQTPTNLPTAASPRIGLRGHLSKIKIDRNDSGSAEF
jgi:hypothetical protein